jgi:hypothetical protein
MIRFTFYSLLFLCFANHAVAEEKPTILILKLSSQSLDKETLNGLDALLEVEISKYENFESLSTNDVKQLLELEKEKQLAGCFDDSCLGELAGALGAQYLIFGDAGKLGSNLMVTLSLFDAEKAQSSSRVLLQGADVDALAKTFPQGVEDLLKQGVAKIDLSNKAGLSPLVYYSGLGLTGASAMGSVVAGMMVVYYQMEKDRITEAAIESEQTIDGKTLVPLIEGGNNSLLASLILAPTAIVIGLVSWFVIKPFTDFEDEEEVEE